jgi:hypothetical protein
LCKFLPLKGSTPDLIYTASNYIKERLYSSPTYQLRSFRTLLNIKKLQIGLLSIKLIKDIRKVGNILIIIQNTLQIFQRIDLEQYAPGTAFSI